MVIQLYTLITCKPFGVTTPVATDVPSTLDLSVCRLTRRADRVNVWAEGCLISGREVLTHKKTWERKSFFTELWIILIILLMDETRPTWGKPVKTQFFPLFTGLSKYQVVLSIYLLFFLMGFLLVLAEQKATPMCRIRKIPLNTIDHRFDLF